MCPMSYVIKLVHATLKNKIMRFCAAMDRSKAEREHKPRTCPHLDTVPLNYTKFGDCYFYFNKQKEMLSEGR